MSSAVDSWDVTLRYLEDGFLVAGAQLDGRQAAGVAWRAVDGLEAPIQFFRIRVDADDHPELGGEVWLIGAREHAADAAQLERLRATLRAAFPHADLCFVVDERAGYARVQADNTRRSAVIAAATAVMRYSAAWDESQPITVAVGDERFAATVGFERKSYRVAVRRG